MPGHPGPIPTGAITTGAITTGAITTGAITTGPAAMAQRADGSISQCPRAATAQPGCGGARA